MTKHSLSLNKNLHYKRIFVMRENTFGCRYPGFPSMSIFNLACFVARETEVT